MGRFFTTSATVALMILATGCESSRRPSIPIPSSLQTATSSLAGTKGDWPIDAWWIRYGDPQLDGLIEEGFAHSPTFAAALARIRSAEALSVQVASPLLPQVTTNLSVNDQKQSYNNGIPALFVPRGYNTGPRTTVDLAYDFDLWGKNLALLRAARLEADAVRVDGAAARLALSTSIVSAYVDLARAYRDRDAAQRALEIRVDTAALTRQRLQAGLEARAASKQSDSIQRSAQADLLAIDETIGLDRDRLAALVGAGPDRGVSIQRPAPFPGTGIGVPPHLAADLLGRRPDIVAARLRAEEAGQRVRAAHADFYPDVNLVAFVGAQSLKLDGLTRSGSDIGSLNPAIHLPIFNAGRIAAAYRGSKADYDGAVANYQATVTSALQEVSDTLVGRRTLDARIEQTRAAVQASEEAWRLARIRYQAGLTPQVTLLSAEDQYIGAERSLIALESRAASLDVSLVRALGGGFQDTHAGPGDRHD